MIHNFVPVSHIIQQFNLSPNKTLGQNYLCDENILQDIASINGSLRGYSAIEIGCGPGGLSQMLLNNDVKHLHIIEKDRRFIKASQGWITPFLDRVKIEHADILQIEFTQLVLVHPTVLITNLPYNITSDFLLKAITHNTRIPDKKFTHMTMLLQKEVVQRLQGIPGQKNYGRMSVLTQLTHEIVEHFDIPAHKFFPPPKIVSTLVSLFPRNLKTTFPLTAIEKITQVFFNNRRKKIGYSMKKLFVDCQVISNKLCLDLNLRPEDLSPQNYLDLALLYCQHNHHKAKNTQA